MKGSEKLVKAIQRIPDFDAQYSTHCRLVNPPLSRRGYALKRMEWEYVVREDPSPETREKLAALSAELGF